ncbi:MAG: SusC/RagA family TonB-linked outer membrane protein [Daejeonella sp.]
MNQTHYLKSFFALLLCLSLNINASAQSNFQVQGTVVGEDKLPMPGVLVTQKGTTKSVASDVNGKYSINISGSQGILVFSFIGYVKKEVPVSGRATINVSLEPDLKSLDEVVVVGYGTRQKRSITGSIASVKAADLKATPIANLAQGLQGRVAGLDMRQNSGLPGGNISIKIRGTNSINGSSEPLYIIDGLQISAGSGINAANPLSQINPSDIESVEVLKDASATAIYGARAANGVVLITTKRGKDGVTKVTYDSYFGLQEVTKRMPVLNAAQFAQLENEIYAPNPVYADPSVYGTGVNWQDMIFRKANIQNHQLSLTGGNDKTQIALGANYYDQDGVIKNSDYKRYAFRANLDHTISKRFKTGTSLYYTVNNENRIQAGGTNVDVSAARGGLLGMAVGAPPTLQPYRADGSIYPFADQYDGRYKEVSNPLGALAVKNYNATNRFLANAYLEINILNGLNYRAVFNTDLASGLNEFYSPRSIVSASSLANPLAINGSAGNSSTYNRSLLHESILTYKTLFRQDHSLNITAVFGSQTDISQSNNQSASGFGNDINQNWATNGAAVMRTSSFKSKSALDSYMGRAAYGYKDKYFLDLTARADGASRFGENHKYGFFPAVSAAWRIIDESFMEPLKFFSDLKLRGSYGITGNAAAIGPYQSLATVSAGGPQNYIFNNQIVSGISPDRIPNADLRWEKSTQYDIGLDMAFFNDRLTIITDYYNKRTNDLLFTKSVPLSSGYGAITGNYGSLENKGVELALTGRILTGSLKWDASGNITFNKNKVLTLDGTQNEIARSSFSILKVGEPLGVYKTYLSDGINQTGEPILPGYDGKTGGYKVKDINGDGKISSADLIITGNAQPKSFFGFSTSLSYRNFDFSGFLQGVQGSKLFNAFRYTFENPLGQANVLAGLADRWSPSNPSNDFIKANQGGRLPLTERYVEDNSYIRLKNITLGYTFTKYKFINSLRAYIAGNNLFTSTNYEGWDPESNSYGSSNTLFFDNGTYPAAKSFVFGIQANF